MYLSIKNGKLILRSKKHNKEVIPHLTNAHNYSNNSLPIYHFLCDYSNQNIRTSLFFDWGGLSKIYDFLPRVEYENIILSKAQWKINSEQIKIFNSAEIIIGTTGAAWSNLIFCKQNTKAIIFSPIFFNSFNAFSNLAQIFNIDLTYSYYSGNKLDHSESNFRINLEDIKSILKSYE